MKQQLQVSKRPQTPATPSQARYPPREVPPRFMQQQKQQQVKGKKAEVDYSSWGESGASDWDQVVVDDRDKDAWPSVGEERSDATWGVIGGEGMGSEYISASSSSPSPVSGSVITGSSGGPNSWPSLGDSRSCSLVTNETMSSVSGNSCGAQSPNHNDWGVSMTNCGNGNISNSGNNGGLDVPGNGNGGAGGGVDASVRRTDSYRLTQHSHVQSSPISEGTNRQQILGDVLMEGVNPSSSMWGTGSSSNSESANGSGGPNAGGWRTANQQPQGHQQQYARTSSGISQNGRNIPNNNVPTGSGLHINENAPSQNYGGAGVGMGMHAAANSNLVNAQYSSSNGSSLADMQSDNSSGNNSGSGARNETRGGISGWNAPPSRMVLLGGGESSVNTGTSGWGNASGSNNGGSGGSGWNTSPSTNSAQSQWGTSGNGGNGSRNGGSSGAVVSQVSPTKPINTWAQAAGKGLNSGGGSSSGSQGSCVIGPRESQPELEIRQAITSHDEWGQGSVNQDTAWDLPGGSEESPKDKTAMWKASQNNGTEIWENTVRNGGKSSNNVATPTNSQPWGANPSTNIGGTWGEEEDTSNVWTGVPQSGGARNSSSSDGWGGSGSGGGGSSGGNGNGNGDKMWNGPTKEPNQWSSGNNNSSGGNNSIGNNGGGNSGGGNNGGGNGGGNNGGGNNGSGNNGGGNNGGGNIGSGNIGSGNNGGGNIGSGNIGSGNNGDGNGSGSGWGEPCANNSVVNDGDDGTNAWGAPIPKVINQQREQREQRMPPKDLKIGGGWEEPSPPPVRRGMTSVDDGTAVWGSPNSHNKVSRWKEAPAMNTKGPNLSSQSSSSGQGQPGQGSGVIRIPPGTPTLAKPENNIGVWGKSVPQNRWGDSNHEMNNTWDEGMGSSGMRSGNNSSSGNSGGGNGSWGEPSSPLANNWENKSKSSSNWNDNMHVNTANWGQPLKQGAKPLSKDLIWASRHFRLLHDMGFKKEDVENALRNASMNYDDALHELQGGGGNNLQMGDNDVFSSGHHASIRGDDDHSSVIDASFQNTNPSNFGNNIYTNSGIIGGAPNPTNTAFKSQANLINNGNMFHGVSGHNNQLGNLMPGVGNFNPNLVQKLLQQQQQQQLQQHQPQHLQQFQPNMSGGNRSNQQNVPSTNQLRLIVQQIQMAVTAGHLNPQILNQPLSPQTLLLLNQLLNQIKQLQQLQLTSQPLGKANSSTALHISVQITKTKQQITNLQNQIVAQQAAYLKQQQIQQHLQQQQHAVVAAAVNAELLKPPLDPLNLIHGGLQDLSVKDPTPGTPTSTSRLSQWKVPMEKELDPASNLGGNSLSGGDFSRAPGTVTKMPTGSSGFSATSIFGQTDSTWSLNRTHSDSGWPDGSSSGDSAMNGNGGASDQWSSSNQNYNIMEFEPGKPWKGSMKNVEDDPHITPGSVARSPLNAIKESELFNSLSKNQVPSSENSFTTPNLSSATWSFNSANATGPATSSVANPGLNYSGGKFGTKWEMGSETHAPSINSELWGNVSSKTRGPPPGLGTQNKIPVTSTWGNNGGGVNASTGNGIGNRQGWTASSGWERPTVSTWLMLRNLTPQIDGSTLRTLCMQHGPLSAFHLYLSQGIALVRYSSREEATKAQSALNNCVLGNTTIFAEFANEVDIQQFLQQSGNATNVAWGQQGNGGNNGSNGGTGGNNGGMRSNSSVAPSAGSSSFTQYSNKNDVGGGGGPSHWSGGGLNLHSGQLWSSLQSPPNSGNLWGNSALTDPMDHRGTPSSLNSYLPGDLLGSESV